MEKVKINTIDDYFALQSEKNCEALARAWEIIAKAAPKAEVGISYGFPIFKYHGMLVGFAAFKNHCSFFTCHGTLLQQFKKEIKDFGSAASAIHFTYEKPIPAALITKIVKIRMKQNMDKELLKKNKKTITKTKKPLKKKKTI